MQDTGGGRTVNIFRNADAVWREETIRKEEASKGLETGDDVSGVGTSIILLHGRIHSLNILGTEIWKLCEGRTPEEIIAAIEEEFDSDPEILRRDVISFLEDLKGLGLIYEE